MPNLKLCSLFALSFSCINAQTPTLQIPTPHQDTVVVTGAWEPVALDESDRSVNQYPVNNETFLFGNVGDVFSQDSSIYVQSRGANGLQADYSIRGASFEQTLMLVNGIRMNDEQSAHYNSDLPIPMDAIDHIEVLRGAGSTLYGSDATGGVINIITKPTRETDPIELVLRGDYGSFNTNEQSGFLSLTHGPVSERFAFERELSDGFTNDRDYRNYSLSSDSWLQSRLGLTRVFLGLDDRRFGADQFYGPYNSWERTKAWLATISQDLGKHTLFTLGYRRHSDIFVLLREDPSVYTNHHIDEAWDTAIRRNDPIGKLVHVYYGAELTADNVRSNNLGIHSRKQGAVYGAFDIRSLRRASLSFGAREEFYGDNQNIFVPNVSGGYWLSSTVKLRGSISRAFRLPNYTDLYYSDPANLGNPNLKPETATSFEGGVDWHRSNRVRASATVFNRREHDDIDYVRANASSIWQAMNFDRINFIGGEAELSFALTSHQTVSVGFTALNGGAEALNGYQSKYVFNYPTEQAVVSWEKLSTQGWVARFRTGVTNQYQRNAYVLVDASAGWTRSRVHPYLRVTNLSNADYQPVYGITMPGRAITGGIELALLGRAK